MVVRCSLLHLPEKWINDSRGVGSYENKSETKHMIILGLQTEVLTKPIWQNRYYDLNVSPKSVYVALLNAKSDGVGNWGL